uniref:Uncharacterized protein n=1 Tax=Wuchereria bancrofti TaxID=6293 RepID=A0AAF5PGI4_WUCBA
MKIGQNISIRSGEVLKRMSLVVGIGSACYRLLVEPEEADESTIDCGSHLLILDKSRLLVEPEEADESTIDCGSAGFVSFLSFCLIYCVTESSNVRLHFTDMLSKALDIFPVLLLLLRMKQFLGYAEIAHKEQIFEWINRTANRLLELSRRIAVSSDSTTPSLKYCRKCEPKLLLV